MLQKKLIRLAKRADACPRLYELAACKTDSELVALMFRHWDFVREKKFPPITLLRACKEMLLSHGVWVDDPDARIAGTAKVALFNSSAIAVASGFDSQAIYATSISSLQIMAKDHALVVVDASGMTDVSIEASDKAAVIITLHDNASIRTNKHKHIKVIDKRHVKI